MLHSRNALRTIAMASKFTRIASMSARNSRFNLLSKAYFSSFPDHLVVAMPALSPVSNHDSFGTDEICFLLMNAVSCSLI